MMSKSAEYEGLLLINSERKVIIHILGKFLHILCSRYTVCGQGQARLAQGSTRPDPIGPGGQARLLVNWPDLPRACHVMSLSATSIVDNSNDATHQLNHHIHQPRHPLAPSTNPFCSCHQHKSAWSARGLEDETQEVSFFINQLLLTLLTFTVIRRWPGGPGGRELYIPTYGRHPTTRTLRTTTTTAMHLTQRCAVF
jgi:hypothetical protein